MPRQNRRRVDAPSQARGGGAERREQWRGETFSVRSISGQAASKPYRCPGCDQEIPTGVAHIVSWPTHEVSAADRRHWHHGCWDAREYRRPGVLRSRSAPRY